MGYGLLNMGSLVLGLMAWAVSLWYMRRLAAGRTRKSWPAAVSLGCCAASLWLQILYNRHLANIEDVAAILDTFDAVAKISGFLLVTTAVLNAAALFVERKMEKQT